MLIVEGEHDEQLTHLWVPASP